MNDEIYDDEQDEQELPEVSFGTRAGIFGGTIAAAGIADLAAHLGVYGFAGGAFLAVLLTAKSPRIVALRQKYLPELPDALRKLGQRFNNRLAVAGEDEGEEEEREEYAQLAEALADEPEPVNHALFGTQTQRPIASFPIDRVTVEAICEHLTRNSYTLYVGRSLNREGYPAVPLNWYKQHIEIIGKSQRGKSSMAAAIMEIITRTHDPEYVRLALLDMEDQTSKLFAHLPHVMTWKGTRLHARTPEEVVAHLDLIIEILKYRYTLPAQERANLPVLLVYLEEFLALKNQLKSEIGLLKGEEFKVQREEAIRAYAQVVLAVNMIALRGLKARVQFLLCAQVDYADKDFREALAMFGIRFSFCVDPDAARAAGFTANELLAQNAEEDQFGQAVLEARGIKDLLLAPDYDLEQRIIALEATLVQQWPAAHGMLPETPVPEQARQKIYHSNAATADQATRTRERNRRLRGDARQIVPARKAQVVQPTEPEVQEVTLPITDLTAYFKPEQHIPALSEVVAAFPHQLPSKRDIAKHFDITDHQAYKLYKQLEKKLEEAGGRMVGRSSEERMVKQ